MVEKLLFEVLSVFFPPEVGVNRGHSFVVDVRKGFLRRAPIQVQQQQGGQVGHLPGEGDHVGILQVELFQLVALADLDWHLAEGVIVQPQDLQIGKLTNLNIEPD